MCLVSGWAAVSPRLSFLHYNKITIKTMTQRQINEQTEKKKRSAEDCLFVFLLCSACALFQWVLRRERERPSNRNQNRKICFSCTQTVVLWILFFSVLRLFVCFSHFSMRFSRYAYILRQFLWDTFFFGLKFECCARVRVCISPPHPEMCASIIESKNESEQERKQP